MAIVYIGMVLIILLLNIDQIVPMIGTIIKSAFGVQQVTGGAVGAAILQGIKRGLFSNEAGMGCAPNAAATAAVPHPVKQGLIQSLGVFFDTMLVCTATAIMILLYSGLQFGDSASRCSSYAISVERTFRFSRRYFPNCSSYLICIFICCR